MTVLHVDVERFSITSGHPFERVLERLQAAIGKADMQALANAAGQGVTYEAYGALVRSMVGPSDLMEMLSLDIGAVLRKAHGPSARRSRRFIVGNPLIMQQMVVQVPDAASYAPVTILVDERPDGVHLSYDRVASFLRPYRNAAALEVATSLDTKVEQLLTHAALHP